MRTKLVDIVFANRSEAISLYQTSDFDSAIAALREENVLGVVTLSEHGSIAVRGDQTWTAPAFPVERVVDTTGAGDLFAAGYMAGLARDADPVVCARLGALAAAEVIGHLGARPQTALKGLAEQNGLG